MAVHGDVESGVVEVLGPGRAADGAVVLGAAIGGADDRGLPQPVAQRLQLVERGRVDEQLASAPAGDLGRAEMRRRDGPDLQPSPTLEPLILKENPTADIGARLS